VDVQSLRNHGSSKIGTSSLARQSCFLASTAASVMRTTGLQLHPKLDASVFEVKAEATRWAATNQSTICRCSSDLRL
jgi:hypothetical protein